VTDYVVLESTWAQTRGVIGREPTPEQCFVFEFDDVDERAVHMVGVRSPLKVTWLIEGSINHEAVLKPWTGHDRARADMVLEESVDSSGRQRNVPNALAND